MHGQQNIKSRPGTRPVCSLLVETRTVGQKLLVVVMSLVQGLPFFYPTQKHNYKFNPLQ